MQRTMRKTTYLCLAVTGVCYLLVMPRRLTRTCSWRPIREFDRAAGGSERSAKASF